MLSPFCVSTQYMRFLSGDNTINSKKLLTYYAKCCIINI